MTDRPRESSAVSSLSPKGCDKASHGLDAVGGSAAGRSPRCFHVGALGVRLDLCPWCTKTLAECTCWYVERRPRRCAAYTLARGRVAW